MPRGIPNAKRDDTGLKYTSYHVPLLPNPKQAGSSYLKSEHQIIWNRERPVVVPTEAEASAKRGSKVLVIHPGSRFFRIGRASDFKPVSIPSVVARKLRCSANDCYHPAPLQRISDENIEENIGRVSSSLVDRMRFYHLRPTPRFQSTQSCASFNERAKPEIIPEHNDPFRVAWLNNTDQDTIVGEAALKIPEPQKMGYLVRWPIYGHDLNTTQYNSNQSILSDIETIIQHALQQPNIDIQPKDYPSYSVVLVIPDLYSRSYVTAMVNLLLVQIGFMRVCVQQESLAATYGAGLSSSIVVDMGATVTSVACVDEGLVNPDSRLSLSVGADDVTEFLAVLLNRIRFPVGHLGVQNSKDRPDDEEPNAGWRWDSMEDIKFSCCSLSEADVAANLHSFVVRRPGKPAEKYQMKAYDEIILAPMCFFDSRVIDFEAKRRGTTLATNPNISDEILPRNVSEHETQAMVISTQHLVPVLPKPEVPQDLNGKPDASVQDPPPVSEDPKPPVDDLIASNDDSRVGSPTANSMDIDVMSNGDGAEVTATPPVPVPPPDNTGDSEAKPETTSVTTATEGTAAKPEPDAPQSSTAPKIDISFEASKLPLDVAIFNSARAAGGDDKIRKYLQAVLLVGGAALTPGLQQALESRLQAISTPLVQNMEKVQIIPPPREIDPRVVVWKGAAVLGKMDAVSELWVRKVEWDLLGLRALKERCFYI